jgi:hypothetical protein
MWFTVEPASDDSDGVIEGWICAHYDVNFGFLGVWADGTPITRSGKRGVQHQRPLI